MYKIKVLMATYNGEDYLCEQLYSIIRQNEVNVEIIVSDDNSSDSTINILKKNFPDIKYSINNPSSGSAANNFLGMIENLDFSEDFDYISFSDQDDIWMPQKLISSIKCLNNNNAELYCSNLNKWDQKSDSYSLLRKDYPIKNFDYLFEGGSAGCTYVFTKNFGEKLQKFLTDVDRNNWEDFSHDWLVYFFARSRHFKVIIDSNAFINYRIHDSNVHGHLNKLSFRTIKTKTEKVFRGYYIKHAKQYMNYLDTKTIEYDIYKMFISNYFSRNFIIWKYNFQLMRDKKKFIQFAILNLLSFNSKD